MVQSRADDSNGHYVILHELLAMGIMVGDRAAGIVTWNLDFLALSYFGALLLFDHTGREP